MLIQRANVTDIWFEDDEALVIVDDAIFRLSPLAVAIWDVLDGTLTEALTSFVGTMTLNGILMKT